MGVHARKPRRCRMQSSALCRAAEGSGLLGTSATIFFARSTARWVPDTLSATSMDAGTNAKALAPAEMGAGAAAAKRSKSPKAQKSWESTKPSASKACTSHSKASRRLGTSKPRSRLWCSSVNGADRACSTCRATSLGGDAAEYSSVVTAALEGAQPTPLRPHGRENDGGLSCLSTARGPQSSALAVASVTEAVSVTAVVAATPAAPAIAATEAAAHASGAGERGTRGGIAQGATWGLMSAEGPPSGRRWPEVASAP